MHGDLQKAQIDGACQLADVEKAATEYYHTGCEQTCKKRKIELEAKLVEVVPEAGAGVDQVPANEKPKEKSKAKSKEKPASAGSLGKRKSGEKSEERPGEKSPAPQPDVSKSLTQRARPRR